MAYCTNCGGELFETSKFCPHCGAPVLELSSHPEEEKPKGYDAETVSGDFAGLPEVNTGVLTSEEQAAVLEMAAENILEDIPDIKKLDSEAVSINNPEKTHEEPKEPASEVHKEEPKPELPKPSEDKKNETKPETVSETKSEQKIEAVPETVNIPAEPKKKGKGGIIAVIAVLAVAAAGGAFFFLGQRSEPVNNAVEETEVITELTVTSEAETISESEAVSESPETEQPVETSTAIVSELASETEPSVETDISAEEAVSESEAPSETVLSEETAAEGQHTADELKEGIIIEPEHQTAMGSSVSAEISLSGEGISTSILSSGVLFLAEYTTTASAPTNLIPAAMIITIGDAAIDVSATSCSEGLVIFEYDVMLAAVEAAGFTSADIDSVSIKSTGVPIDVYRIKILQG